MPKIHIPQKNLILDAQYGIALMSFLRNSAFSKLGSEIILTTTYW